MTAKSIKLLSPDNSPIVGALLEDGSICNASMTYNLATLVVDIIFDHNGESNFLQENGELIYLDGNGRKWGASAVVDYSILNNRT